MIEKTVIRDIGNFRANLRAAAPLRMRQFAEFTGTPGVFEVGGISVTIEYSGNEGFNKVFTEALLESFSN
jgi:hypothetical protein